MFHFHKWSNWGDIITSPHGSYGFQIRICKTCGCAQSRKVY
jgi:hypothetical protein